MSMPEHNHHPLLCPSREKHNRHRPHTTTKMLMPQAQSRRSSIILCRGNAILSMTMCSNCTSRDGAQQTQNHNTDTHTHTHTAAVENLNKCTAHQTCKHATTLPRNTSSALYGAGDNGGSYVEGTTSHAHTYIQTSQTMHMNCATQTSVHTTMNMV